MKVLYMATYSGTSGASHSLINLILQMKDKGVEPMLIIPHRGSLEKHLIKHGIEYKRVTQYYWIVEKDKPITIQNTVKWYIKSLINIVQELRISRMIKKENIDIVHINAITSSNGYIAAQLSKTPLVWHIREFLEEDLNRDFRNRKKAISRLNKANTVIAVSDSVKNKYQKILNNNNLIRIYNGVDQAYYKNIQNNIFEKKPFLLTLVGRYVPEKGHLEVLYAAQEIIKKHKKSIKVRFIGDKGNDEFFLQLKQVVKKLDLDNYIEFFGYRTDIHEFWSETDIALVTSKAEAFGRVTIEAMLSGALVIGANTEGTAELISDKYGLLYNQGDYESLAEKILYAIDNIDKMKEIVISAKKYAMDNFTAEMNASNILEVYRKIIISKSDKDHY